MISVERLYQSDLASVVCIVDMDTEQKEWLLAHARSGEREAHDALLLSLLPVIRGYALRLQSKWMPATELISVGNITLVEHFDQALQEPSPCGYLLKFAKCEMIDYRQRRGTVITMPKYPGDEPYEISCTLDDFDADQFDIAEPEPEVSTQKDHTPLYEALAALPNEPARLLMVRAFGLNDHHAESLAEIAGGDSTTKEYQSTKARRLDYLKRMRHYLGTHYPAYVKRYASKSATDKTTQLIALPEVTRRKLVTAKEILQVRGEMLSMNKLRILSGVNTRYASVFLCELRMTSVERRHMLQCR